MKVKVNTQLIILLIERNIIFETKEQFKIAIDPLDGKCIRGNDGEFRFYY